MSGSLEGLAARVVAAYRERDTSSQIAYENEMYSRMSGFGRNSAVNRILLEAGLGHAMMERLHELVEAGDFEQAKITYSSAISRFGEGEVLALVEEHRVPLGTFLEASADHQHPLVVASGWMS